MSKKIFISHAVANEALADKLVTLMVAGIGVSHKDVFCSSLEGMDIPSGKNFVEFIKEQITEPEIVILLISEHYKESEFCLAELGAAWALGHEKIPFLVPPLDFSDASGVLASIQCDKINNSRDLSKFRDRIIQVLGIEDAVGTSRWDRKKDQFLDELQECIDSFPPMKKVNIEEHRTLRESYDDALLEISELQEKIKTKDEQIDALESEEPGESRKSISMSFSRVEEQFETIVSHTKESFSPLPHIVVEALYCMMNDYSFSFEAFNDDKNGDISDAAKKGFFSIDDGEVEVCTDNIDIEEALEALNVLKEFLDDIDNREPNFYQQYRKMKRHNPSLSDEPFWKANLY